MREKITVGLLFGGKSSEHEVSLQSAASILTAIDQNKYNLVLVGITKEGQWRSDPNFSSGQLSEILDKGIPVFLASNFEGSGHLIQFDPSSDWVGKKIKIDVFFPVLHGPFGEDGKIQGLFEMANVPYVGAGVLSSAIAIDKCMTKTLFQQAGLPTVPFISMHLEKWNQDQKEIEKKIAETFGYPCFVKPANLGSSIGISRVTRSENLLRALDLATQFDNKILIEKAIEAREIECSVLGNSNPQVSIPGEIITISDFYDYQSKYLNDNTQLVIPAPLETDKVKQIQDFSKRSFQLIDCRGMARVDFFIEKLTNKLYLNEINTIPGFTPISMYPKLWEESGVTYSRLIDKLIELAIEWNNHTK
ncbi:MAG: D-alanine--D-alanine ligase [Acidobacteriia bacterium]|nr:D-alanine--D-alanine ligase [Terriglobia bacterium]